MLYMGYSTQNNERRLHKAPHTVVASTTGKAYQHVAVAKFWRDLLQNISILYNFNLIFKF
jgi:hypothetical protein